MTGKPDHDDTTEFLPVEPFDDATTVFRVEPARPDETIAFAPADERPQQIPIEWQPAPPRRRRWPWVLLGGLVAAAAIAAAVVVGLKSIRPGTDGTGGIATDTPNAKYPPQRDISLDACSIESDGMHVNGTVTNHTADPANYEIDAVMLDQDGALVTQGSTTVGNVAANAAVSWEAVLPPTAVQGTSATCKVVKVNRSPTQ